MSAVNVLDALPPGRRLHRRDDDHDDVGMREFAPIETLVDEPPPSSAVERLEQEREKQRPAAVAPLDYVWAGALPLVLDRRHIVKGLLLPASLIVVYGEPNTGKTYLLFDLGTAISTGRAWRGRKVERGLVVYIAGEGVAGIEHRVAAHRQRGLLLENSPFAIIRRAASFLADSSDVDELLALVRAMEAECGDKCTLVIVDTLSRAMPGADENTAEAMTAVVASADRIRRDTGAAVAFIHHAGKDATRGARGHSSLKGAVDTEIVVEGQAGTRTARVSKQRDLPSGDTFNFDLDVVVLGHDPDGDAVTACVVRHADEGAPAPVATASPKRPLGKNQERALVAIREWARTNPGEHIPGDALTDLLKAQGLPRARRAEVIRALSQCGVLIPAVAGHRVVRDAL